MSTEANVDLARRWVEQVWNAGKLEQLEDLFPETFANEGQTGTVEYLKEWQRRSRATFPDIHYTIDDLFATEDRVALRWTATATHSGTLWGFIPPTGKSITWNGIHLLRIAGGRIVEVWAVGNTVAQLRQMGVSLHPAADSTEPV